MSDHVDILLYGLGAIGSFYAFILSIPPQVQLSVVCRSNYEAVKARGLQITSENHGQHTITPVQVLRDPSEAGKTFDYIVCAHKAIDQDAVPKRLAPAVGPNTTLVIIQNGVGNEDPFRASFPNNTILSCVTWVGATQASPGVIKHTKSEDMQIGLFPNTSLDSSREQQRLQAFARLLTEGKTVFQVVPNVQIQRWEKVVWNAAWNSLTSMTLLSTHDWLNSSEDATPMTRQLMREVIDVARACHVPLEYDLIDRLNAKILAMPPIGSSMRTDVENGRPLEVDVILGTPVRRAKEKGIQVPVLQTLYTVMRGIDMRMRNQ
ncbi:uncharacterized protein HMPREF1541_08504 [Cyphellophora europaea CBS 101466]|uniref:2-dehydropantoate 2-reductase n=1 Tax=Cyphellophora europaea (strain CBS 101466) TaxID=1220924 RepID=W2RI81_CYPE1|nr:uncharacterized protein HMPREF1541_08504 [Cyphellophora europaea CBS 101466]ETN36227.1 hypothetical protein HMPREF1541_08504 [Cyphellophora europaea CBS 101466]